MIGENQTNSTIDLAWDVPTVCGDTVVSYNVTFNGQTINTGSNALTFQLTGLAAFTNYTITITAINMIGAGNASNTIVVQTSENSKLKSTTNTLIRMHCMHNNVYNPPQCVLLVSTVPSEPQNLLGAALNATSVGLRWDPPQLPNGILRRYIVKYSNGSMVGDMPYTQVVDAGSLSATVTNLMNNTNYTFAIVAANNAGNSTCSEEITIMTPGMYVHTCMYTHMPTLCRYGGMYGGYGVNVYTLVGGQSVGGSKKYCPDIRMYAHMSYSTGQSDIRNSTGHQTGFIILD